RHVCMRALPADSFEYFGEIADGKLAFPDDPMPVVWGRAGAASRPFGAAVFASVAGVAAGAAEAVGPHSALRKSFHFVPFNVPADCAALYFALHSFIVRALPEDSGRTRSAAASVAAHGMSERVSMGTLLDIGGPS